MGRIVFLIVSIIWVAGCADKGDDVSDASADGDCPEGMTRRNGPVVERCEAGQWISWTDCPGNELQHTVYNGDFSASGRPVLVADIPGDWRQERVVRESDNRK